MSSPERKKTKKEEENGKENNPRSSQRLHSLMKVNSPEQNATVTPTPTPTTKLAPILTTPTQDRYRTSDAFFRLLIDTKVEDLRPPDGRVYVCQKHERVVEVWKGLLERNFLSVPVMQKTNRTKYFGFLDLQDIVSKVVSMFGEIRLKNVDDFWVLVKEEVAFQDLTVQDIIKPSRRKERWVTVKKGYSLLLAAEILARERGVRRIPVLMEDMKLYSLVTQSQVVRFLHQHAGIIGPKKDKPVFLCPHFFHKVLSVSDSSTTIEAFDLMHQENVGGVAVVNSQGELVGSVTPRELKVICTSTGMFWKLFLSLRKNLTREMSASSVSKDKRLVEVLEMMAVNSLHRIFIVDEGNHPIGLISLKDLLLEILKTSL